MNTFTVIFTPIVNGVESVHKIPPPSHEVQLEAEDCIDALSGAFDKLKGKLRQPAEH